MKGALPDTDLLDMTILDADPPVTELGCCAVGDIDGDGNVEIVIGGAGALLWYRLATHERGLIAEGRFAVSLALEDLDGDGKLEIVAAQREKDDGPWRIKIYRTTGGMAGPWESFVIDGDRVGSAHDILFADIDGDGELEMIANQSYCDPWALYVYKRAGSPFGPWNRHTVMSGFVEEAIAVADIDGDGHMEIVSGPNWYDCPSGNPMTGDWIRKPFAPDFREMVRVAAVDITGNGRPDVVIAESEYPDGRLSWFENRVGARNEWVEHELDAGYVFAHSLEARRDPASGTVSLFLAEMASGGWNQGYNLDARLVEFASGDNGVSWERRFLHRGCGTHQAVRCDVDGDGKEEVVGKVWGWHDGSYIVQVYKEAHESPIKRMTHRFIDRDKPCTGTDILHADIDGDGLNDLVCARWWYRNPTWERFEIPGIYQAVAAYDIDGDGRIELIATKENSTPPFGGWYGKLSSDLVWLKPIDPVAGKWKEYPIGTGTGDWPHGTLVGPYGPGGRLAFVAGYHDCTSNKAPHYPEIFVAPADPASGPWEKSVLAKIAYGEEFVAADIDGDGAVEIVAGGTLLTWDGELWRPITIVKDFKAARVALADITGNGLPDIVLGEEVLDFEKQVVPFSRVLWCENPGEPGGEWHVHVVDKVKCAHSVSAADLDGDGQCEIVVGEHNPFRPCRSRSRLFVYKKADPKGLSWTRLLVDPRFEHHDGAKVVEIAPGKLGIVSHGWQEGQYVHLWA